MYTAARFFVVIGMIVTAIIGLTNFPFGLLFTAAAIIVGIYALAELKDEFKKPSLLVSILAIFFCGLVAGIIMLCIPESKSRTSASIATNLQCAKCGKHDVSVKYYTVNSALGKMNRPYCPECKALVDEENKK